MLTTLADEAVGLSVAPSGPTRVSEPLLVATLRNWPVTPGKVPTTPKSPAGMDTWTVLPRAATPDVVVARLKVRTPPGVESAAS